MNAGLFERAGDGTRTRDLLITNQLLCQLSYAGVFGTYLVLTVPKHTRERLNAEYCSEPGRVSQRPMDH